MGHARDVRGHGRDTRTRPGAQGKACYAPAMPHDMNGTKLEVGDLVLVPCLVTQVMTGAEYCNVTLQTEKPMFPSQHPTGISLNASQVRKV